MITLIRNNVMKIVDSEEKAEKLKAKGFALFSSAKAEAGRGEKSELFQCPYCEKTYKTQKGLDDHIAKEHPNGGGGNNGADPATNNAGGTQ